MYVVTGATGHVGNNIVRYLLDMGEKVRVLVRTESKSLLGLEVETCVSQQFDDLFLRTHIHSGDIVIHAAGYINLYNHDKLMTFRANYLMTKKIVDMCIEKKNRLIYISSVDIIEKPLSGIIHEPTSFTEKKRKSYYQASKHIATKYVYESMKKGLHAVILYPSAVIGPYDFKPSQVGLEIKHILNHKILFSIKGGYNFIDARDVAKGVYLASKKEISEHMILSGHNRSITELYIQCSNIVGKKKIIITIPIWIVRMSVLFSSKYSKIMLNSVLENYQYDDSKRKVHLFDELIAFDQTLEDTIKWLTR
jgi:dihydroflavonol-4-reductase